ncbi:hypothetical protein L1887_25487 [Cichorium endivia]|nr:hypothetical protein L1887_25487 [Cichorium endivia]
MNELFSKLKRPFDGTWDAVESDKAAFECIMFRLPVRSILMSKSVSKFCESYTIPGFESIHNPLLIASFNGLICCVNDVSPYRRSYDVDLLVCNPATREVLVLPSSHLSVYMPTFGVLYSNNYHIYKIFKFFSDPIDFEMGYTQCEVYSSKTGEWNLLGRVPSHPIRNPSRPLVSNHVCVNEKLYWFISDGEEFDIPSSILMVDMDNNFWEISLPTYAEISFLIEFQGRLCFVDWTGFNIYLWIYDESNESWYLKDIPPFPVNWLEVAHFDSVVARKHDILFVYKDVAGLRHEILYDMRYATWKEFRIAQDAKDKAIVVFPFFETLVPCSKYRVFGLG